MQQHTLPRTGSFGLAASLALVAVLGPAGIDMYLASMPAMARELHTSYANVRLSLTVFLLAMGMGQLLCGPLTDMLGRRRPLPWLLFLTAAGLLVSWLTLVSARSCHLQTASLPLH